MKLLEFVKKLSGGTFVFVSIAMLAVTPIPAEACDPGQSGTTLTADVDITPHWTKTFTWTIDKSVTPEALELWSGDSGSVTYTITVTKDAGTEEAWVDGEVCVTNGGAVATQDLNIVAELKDGYEPPNDFLASAPVDVSGNPILDPGETGCYDYRVNIPITGGDYPQPHAGGTYKVTANVTITNHSGHLGIPFGPSPSATATFLPEPLLVHDSITVDDTNGYSWDFNSSGSVYYDKTFTCDDDAGTKLNVASITFKDDVLPGPYDQVEVDVKCQQKLQGTLLIIKFYDANANGVQDPSELELDQWKVGIGGDIYCTPVSQDLDYGTYTVSEFMPTEPNWLATTPSTVEAEVPVSGPITVSFGNLCLGAGGGRTIGFWSNKNGEKTMDDDGGMGPKLTMLSDLNLRDGAGNDFDPGNYPEFRTWLLHAKAHNMAYMLSAQLAAMALNVEANTAEAKFVNADSLVYASCGIPGVEGDYISIAGLMSAANAALGENGYTSSDDPDRAYQECLKNALDNANNNKNFVQPLPCTYTFVDSCPQAQ